MKKLLVSIGLMVSGIALAADFEVQIRSDGTDVPQRPAPEFATNVLNLFESCGVNSTAYAATNTWEALLAQDSFIHLRLSAPVRFTITGEPNMNEVLVPLPTGKLPAHLFARSGTNVFALTKYDPVALNRVAKEPALRLSSVEPYISLARVAASQERQRR